MQIQSEITLSIPQQLIDLIAVQVADEVVARINNQRASAPAQVPKPPKPAKHDDHPVEVTFLRLPEIVKWVGLARSSIYAKMADGTFPLSVKLGGRSVAWRRVDVERWEADPYSYNAK